MLKRESYKRNGSERPKGICHPCLFEQLFTNASGSEHPPHSVSSQSDVFLNLVIWGLAHKVGGSEKLEEQQYMLMGAGKI